MFKKQTKIKSEIKGTLSSLFEFKENEPLPYIENLDNYIKRLDPSIKEEYEPIPTVEMNWNAFKNKIETTGYTPQYFADLKFIQSIIEHMANDSILELPENKKLKRNNNHHDDDSPDALFYDKAKGGKRRRSTKRKTKRSKRKQKRNTKRRASHRRRR